MATEEINYRVDIKRPDGSWDRWAGRQDLRSAKAEQLAVLKHPLPAVRDARIVEVRRTYTETVLGVDAASLNIMSREEILT